ncbi:UNVERIFIED_CONTAM: hypothetical protein HDU68_003871 [Siphonaria sp. JEL0065]|nr:hypothetical protein HDU68_003871 [Siphonaria sp. JEL0065]
MATPQPSSTGTGSKASAKGSKRKAVKWSFLDDIQLKNGVLSHGTNWAHIASSLRNKTATDCLERYAILQKNPQMTLMPPGSVQPQIQPPHQLPIRMVTRSARQSPVKQSQPPPPNLPPAADQAFDFLFGVDAADFPNVPLVLDIPQQQQQLLQQSVPAKKIPSTAFANVPAPAPQKKTRSKNTRSSTPKVYVCPYGCGVTYDISQSFKYHVQTCKLKSKCSRPPPHPCSSSSRPATSGKQTRSSQMPLPQSVLWSEDTPQGFQSPAVITPGPGADFAQFDFNSDFDLEDFLNGSSSVDQFMNQIPKHQPPYSQTRPPLHQQSHIEQQQPHVHPMMTRNAQLRFAPTGLQQRLQQQHFQQYGPYAQQHQLSLSSGSSAMVVNNSKPNQFSSSAASSPVHHSQQSAPFTQQLMNYRNIAMKPPPAVKRMHTGISRGESKEVESLIQCPMVEPHWAWTPAEVFSVTQLSVLKMQMNNNFQLVSQAYVIEKELHGSGADETLYWQDQLKCLESQRVWGVTIFGPTSYHNTTPIAKLEQIFSLPAPTYKTARSPASREFVRFMNYQVSESEYRDRVSRLQKKNNLAGSSGAVGGLTVIPLFEGLIKLGQVFRAAWSRDLVPEIVRGIRRKRTDFALSEDVMLVKGVISFGLNDLNGIRAHCLPAKTVDSIESRIATLRGRNREDNSLKALLLKPFKPITIFEKDLIRQGIQNRGSIILPRLLHLFPHHPASLIKNLWEAMIRMGEINVPFPVEGAPLFFPNQPDAISVEEEEAEYSDEDGDEDEDGLDEDDSEDEEDEDEGPGCGGGEENDIFALLNDDAYGDDDEEDTDDGDFDPNDGGEKRGGDGGGGVKNGVRSSISKGKQARKADEELGSSYEEDEMSFLSLLNFEVAEGDGGGVSAVTDVPEPQVTTTATVAGKKRKSVATRIQLTGPENDENWSFRTHKDSKVRLRKLSLMDKTSSSTLGRGHVRGKKKTASMIPTLSARTSPTQGPVEEEELFKKPLPVSRRMSHFECLFR